jgi:hypothetical protein
MPYRVLIFTGVYQMKCHTRKRSYIRQTGHKFELRHKAYIRYITTSNPNQHNPTILFLAHMNNTEPVKLRTMMLLQLAHKGRGMNVLTYCYVQFFQHNNIIVNEQVQKKGSTF